MDVRLYYECQPLIFTKTMCLPSFKYKFKYHIITKYARKP